jgi:hypothetical protein
MLKRTLALYLAILCSVTTMAQWVNVRETIWKQQFSKKTMDQLKATTTVFFYSKQQEATIDSIKQAVSEVWKITPLIFDEISNFDKYASDPKYSFFGIEALSSEVRYGSSGGSSGYSNTHFFLTLRLFKEATKKGNIIRTPLCRIELYPNAQTLLKGGKVPNLYSNESFFNWSPILLKAQLAAVSTNLENNFKPDHYDEFKDKDLSNILSTETLYVPKTVLIGTENIFNGYRYKYKVSEDDELFELFQASKKGRLLFEYVRSSTDKFVTIYDLQQKKVIYRSYVAVSYNLKSKDIETIK